MLWGGAMGGALQERRLLQRRPEWGVATERLALASCGGGGGSGCSSNKREEMDRCSHVTRQREVELDIETDDVDREDGDAERDLIARRELFGEAESVRRRIVHELEALRNARTA